MDKSVAIVGAGFSGLCIASRLKQRGLENFTIFDKNEDVGGVWMVSRYPGAACDVSTYLYSFSFCLNPNWSSFFCEQKEIQEYARYVARKYDLYRHTHFKTQVTKLKWIHEDSTWELTSQGTDTSEIKVYRFDLVFMGVGALRTPNIPSEFASFKGPMMHSSQWRSDVQIKSKRVGIVGSGTSAIQIIPEISKDVEHLTVFQRRPAWIVPRPQFRIPPFLQTVFRLIPGLLWFTRICLFWLCEAVFPAFTTNSFVNIGKLGKDYLTHSIKDNEELKKQLEPNYPFGCKRYGIHSGYYDTMKLSHVNLVTSSIKEVRGHSIVTEDGVETPIEVLILATGFKVHEYYAPLEIMGMNGDDPIEKWKAEGPSNYRGIVSSDLPNVFFIGGPNTMFGHNSPLFAMECQSNWCLQVVEEMVRRKCKVVRVKKWAEEAQRNQILEKMKSTVWAQDCGSWYKNQKGVVTGINPMRAVSYWAATRTPDFETLSFQSNQNQQPK